MNKIISFLLLIVLLASGHVASTQTLPVVSVRFYNPVYDCPTETYCLEVQFKSDTPLKQLFGMNLRFFYDDAILEYIGTGDFKPGYNLQEEPLIITGEGSEYFGFTGAPEFINGSVQMTDSALAAVLPTDDWLMLFKVCFHVDDPNSLDIQNFCPSVVWDLQQNPPADNPGFLPGDDGVVMSVFDPGPYQDSSPATEEVVQFNWQYLNDSDYFGIPVEIICIPTSCWEVPIKDWAIYLAIGLMIIASAIIYRRRI